MRETQLMCEGAVVLRELGGHSLLHAGSAAGPLVRRLRSAHLCRRLLRVPQAAHRAARPHQSDPATDSGPERLHSGTYLYNQIGTVRTYPVPGQGVYTQVANRVADPDTNPDLLGRIRSRIRKIFTGSVSGSYRYGTLAM